MASYRTDAAAARPEPEPALSYTVERTAEIIGIGRTTVYELIKSGQLDARRLGGRTLIMAASVHSLLAGLPRLNGVAA